LFFSTWTEGLTHAQTEHGDHAIRHFILWLALRQDHPSRAPHCLIILALAKEHRFRLSVDDPFDRRRRQTVDTR
jgi:diadenosine tetraphosphate (Ap4A) HIT family hydrolase